MTDTVERLGNIFEERAEYLSKDQLISWTALSARETTAVGKLKGNGAKLLIGPRGSGKSTLMRLAYFELLEDEDALPVYVNYAKHLALEPLFRRRPDATEIFRQWVIAKVLLGVSDTFDDVIPETDREELFSDAIEYINNVEVGRVDEAHREISPTVLLSRLADFARLCGRKRVVLLFDDAAHAFSAQQQREFFEIFRQLRTRLVAPKAAVYPGVTNYSANMHVGHDAEVVEAWYRSDDSQYMATMRQVLEKRLPATLMSEFSGDRAELLEYLALASFGLPRSFLTMVQDVLEFDEDQGRHVSPTRRRADAAIERNVSNVRNVYESTGVKIPRYSNLIEEGRRLEDSFLSHLQRFNTSKTPDAKVVTAGVRRPITREFQQVVDLMAYAGLVRHLDSQSRGSAGVYERYEVHSGFVINANALALGRNPAVSEIISAFNARPAAGVVRGKTESFLGDDYRARCILNLTPCSNCHTPRVSEDAQFCMHCGHQLTERSIYEEMLARPLGDLPLPAKKKAALAGTALRSVQDVLLDVEFKETLQGKSIGPVWAKRIYSTAEEYVSV